jgi:hypothetical protein
LILIGQVAGPWSVVNFSLKELAISNRSFAKRFFLRATSAPTVAKVQPIQRPFARWQFGDLYRIECANRINQDRAVHGTK